MNEETRQYLGEIGRRGGLKSRRQLPPETARTMVRVRLGRKAYHRFHASCFWSYDPDYVIRVQDLPWVVEQLTKHGGHEAWKVADRLCR